MRFVHKGTDLLLMSPGKLPAAPLLGKPKVGRQETPEGQDNLELMGKPGNRKVTLHKEETAQRTRVVTPISVQVCSVFFAQGTKGRSHRFVRLGPSQPKVFSCSLPAADFQGPYLASPPDPS